MLKAVSRMPLTQDDKQRLRDGRLAAKDARTLLREPLGDGWLLFPDAPPGVGWVLAPPSTDEHGAVTEGGGNRRRYYATREAAIQGRLRIKAYGDDPNQKAQA